MSFSIQAAMIQLETSLLPSKSHSPGNFGDFAMHMELLNPPPCLNPPASETPAILPQVTQLHDRLCISRYEEHSEFPGQSGGEGGSGKKGEGKRLEILVSVETTQVALNG